MAKRRTSTATKAPAPAAETPAEAALWSLAVILDRRTLESDGQAHVASPIGQEIEALLAQLGKRVAGGYVAVCAVATPGWHQLDHRRDAHRWLPLVIRRLKPLVKASLRTSADSPEPEQPTVQIDRDRMWCRVVIDSSLEVIKNKVNHEIDSLTKLARKPVEPDSTKDHLPDPQRSLLHQVFDGLPDDYEARSARLAAINAAMHRLTADQLAPALNAHIQAMAHNTYEDKKTLAKWVNEEVRRLDLAIKCPQTGQPSILLVMPGHQPDVGRFVIEHKTPAGKRVRSFTSRDLPDLELMEANPRREALQEWRDRVTQTGSGASRG